MTVNKKTYGIYIVEDLPKQNGKWGGYKVSAAASTGKQGKLFKLTDGREHYQAKPDEELEI
jgi:hypothetical protein